MRSWILLSFLFSLMILRSVAQQRPAPDLLSFTLQESKQQVVQRFGRPQHVTYGRGYEILEYRLEGDEDSEADWAFYFDMPGGRLLRITRSFAEPRVFAPYFPATATSTRTYERSARERWSVQVRAVSPDRTLLGLGMARIQDPGQQLVLVRTEVLSRFYPWLSVQPTPAK